jgi:hypothetical protein
MIAVRNDYSVSQNEEEAEEGRESRVSKAENYIQIVNGTVIEAFRNQCEGDVIKNSFHSQLWWLIPVIITTGEVEIGRITSHRWPGQKIFKTPSPSIIAWHGCAHMSSQLCRKCK